MISGKNAAGIAIFLFTLTFLITSSTGSGEERAMYQVDASNSGFFSDVSTNNTYDPFPFWEEESGFSTYSNPIIIDVDDDGQKDIVYATAGGKLKVLTGDYHTLWEFSTGATVISTPAAADVDKDGDMDIVFAAQTSEDGKAIPKVFCVNHKGEEKWNYTMDSFSDTSFPTIVELTNDPGLEILISSGMKTDGISTSTSLYCISSRGKWLWEFYSVKLQWKIIGTPTVLDIIGDSSPEVIFGVTGDAGLFVLDNEGNEVWTQTPGFRYSTAIAYDIDNAGRPEVIVAVDSNLFCYDNEGNELWNENLTEPAFCTPFAKDIDADGNVEILIASDFLYCFKANGDLKWKQSLEKKVHYSSISFVDIDTGTPEILIGDINGTLYAFSNVGDPLWKVQYGTNMQSSPFVGDVNDDGTPEIFLTIERGERVISSFLDLPLEPITPEFDFEIGLVYMQPLYPVDAHEVTFTVEVINKGNVFSSSEVILVVDNITVDSQYVAIPPPNYDQPDGYLKELTLSWTGVTGDHYIQIIIDPYEDIDELEETNNAYSTSITVISEFIDLVVDNEDITVSHIEGAFYRLSVKVRNTGNLPTGNFTIKLTVNGIDEEFPNINLNPGAFILKHKTISTVDAKSFLISVELDPDGRVAEANETNNLADKIIDLSGGKDDPDATINLDEWWALLLFIPVILIAIALYFNNKSNRKNYDLMQDTLNELKENLAAKQVRDDHYRPRESYPPPRDYYRDRDMDHQNSRDRSTSQTPTSPDTTADEVSAEENSKDKPQMDNSASNEQKETPITSSAENFSTEPSKSEDDR